MHPSNPYFLKPVNFDELAREYPNTFGKFFSNANSTRGRFDWKKEDAVATLTETLLSRDFKLNVRLRRDRLCPPLPNRLNYLCWLKDLLLESQHTGSDAVTLLDIGTGASCIYPILGNRQFGWSFLASDIDVEALSGASEVLQMNPDLQDSIRILDCSFHHHCNSELQEYISTNIISQLGTWTKANLKYSGSSLMLPLVECCRRHKNKIQQEEDMNSCSSFSTTHHSSYRSRGPLRQALYVAGGNEKSVVLECERDCYGRNSNLEKTDQSEKQQSQLSQTAPTVSSVTMTMCNPPFYDLDEMIEPNEYTVCSGVSIEMRTPGGEVAFVAAIIADSLILQTRLVGCSWYTSMLGKKTSLRPLRHLLKKEGIANVRTTSFVQGFTRRWGLAWSFLPRDAMKSKDTNRKRKCGDGEVSNNITTVDGEDFWCYKPARHAYCQNITVEAIRETISCDEVVPPLLLCLDCRRPAEGGAWSGLCDDGFNSNDSTSVSTHRGRLIDACLTILEQRVATALRVIMNNNESCEKDHRAQKDNCKDDSLGHYSYIYTLGDFKSKANDRVNDESAKGSDDDDDGDVDEDARPDMTNLYSLQGDDRAVQELLCEERAKGSGFPGDNELMRTCDNDKTRVREALCVVTHNQPCGSVTRMYRFLVRIICQEELSLKPTLNVAGASKKDDVFSTTCLRCQELLWTCSEEDASSSAVREETAPLFSVLSFLIEDDVNGYSETIRNNFNILVEKLQNELLRTNRKWRRRLAKEAQNKGVLK